ncbi:merozoite surface protein [Reticulomyxa filosa]|uniref:Merozoite surface protein n=1 Tax=Reticulomyxa filosa TaxID=46433 RepID=X6MPT7_RETFI|nr:merozoite surface protein [Reticulomyxa filosa]|eukprot:ETO15110.1 merozoite surface protein [Reticulomyxa filosa]
MILKKKKNDPFFLFVLTVSEMEFYQLKTEQALLVDFNGFPKSLMSLFQQCLKCKQDEHPKYDNFLVFVWCCQLSAKKNFKKAKQNKTKQRFVAVLSHGNHDTTTILSVQETNQFRHLQHIALKLKCANDESLKKHLSNCWMRFRTESLQLAKDLSECKVQLQQALADKHKSQELAQQIKQKLDHSVSELKFFLFDKNINI